MRQLLPVSSADNTVYIYYAFRVGSVLRLAPGYLINHHKIFAWNTHYSNIWYSTQFFSVTEKKLTAKNHIRIYYSFIIRVQDCV